MLSSRLFSPRLRCGVASPAILALAMVSASPATAQGNAVGVIAVPQLATPKNEPTPAGDTGVIARQIADVIAQDLRSSGAFVTFGPERSRVYGFAEATAPTFRLWRTTGAKSLVTGFVTAREDGRVTVGCYLHDIAAGREIARQGFVISPSDWRRAAHRCADAVYSKLTGRSSGFDSLVAYVAESGTGVNRVKRVALMASDGSDHRYVTAGDTTVVTPRLSPGGDRIAYVSFTGGRPQVRLVDLESNADRLLAPDSEMSFSPRFSPDRRQVALSIASGGNSDIHLVDLETGTMQRLASSPGIDTSPSFSPDGRQIVFESDRSGSPQLYVMNSDGSSPRRISFGGSRYGSPAWSPDGERIAFTRVAGDGLRVGIMNPDGSSERLLTAGPFDDTPTWGASGHSLIIQRGGGPGGRATLYQIAIDGSEPRQIVTPQGGSDPDWSSGEAK